MKTEGTIGAATLLTIAAVIGFSLQTGPKQESAKADRNGLVNRSKSALTKKETTSRPGCSNLKEQLEDFLETKHLTLPKQCSGPGDAPPNGSQQYLTDKTSELKFVVAILPDPAHTHLPVLFDQFAVAIQEGAQDEKYDFDGSWLPWDDDETSYPLLADEKTSNLEKALRENQPGIILFRKTLDCPENGGKQVGCKEEWPASGKQDENALAKSYRQGLVVFVVGEDATHGIHREQFRNALAWIAALRP